MYSLRIKQAHGKNGNSLLAKKEKLNQAKSIENQMKLYSNNHGNHFVFSTASVLYKVLIVSELELCIVFDGTVFNSNDEKNNNN